jgi:hypothetical protein
MRRASRPPAPPLLQDRTDFWISKADWEEDPHRAMKKSGLA